VLAVWWCQRRIRWGGGYHPSPGGVASSLFQGSRGQQQHVTRHMYCKRCVEWSDPADPAAGVAWILFGSGPLCHSHPQPSAGDQCWWLCGCVCRCCVTSRTFALGSFDTLHQPPLEPCPACTSVLALNHLFKLPLTSELLAAVWLCGCVCRCCVTSRTVGMPGTNHVLWSAASHQHSYGEGVGCCGSQVGCSHCWVVVTALGIRTLVHLRAVWEEGCTCCPGRSAQTKSHRPGTYVTVELQGHTE
jgi:hypothetical protein